MMKKSLTVMGMSAIALGLAGCTTSPSSADYDMMTAKVIEASFKERGIAKLDRLVQDDANRECSTADAAGVNLSEVKIGLFSGDGEPLKDSAGNPMGYMPAKDIEAANMKTIKWPSDGKFLGDWKSGEKIAQSGRGMTWRDKIDGVNGGNCYNCHQISQEEISFGNLGPSLYNYGKLRGVTDPNSAAAKPILEYTWGKIWNARAYNACSQMPRLGHHSVLTQKQIQDVMALLLDPNSPVNK